MSTVAIVLALFAMSGLFALALTGMLLGRPVNFRLGLAWTKADIEFSAGERKAKDQELVPVDLKPVPIEIDTKKPRTAIVHSVSAKPALAPPRRRRPPKLKAS